MAVRQYQSNNKMKILKSKKAAIEIEKIVTILLVIAGLLVAIYFIYWAATNLLG